MKPVMFVKMGTMNQAHIDRIREEGYFVVPFMQEPPLVWIPPQTGSRSTWAIMNGDTK